MAATKRQCATVAGAIGFVLAGGGAQGGGDGWIVFADETAARLVSDPAVGSFDLQEKSYAWGDLDHDGDIDLVVARKQPFTTTGRRRNVLFMNQGLAEGHAINGVLVDRTAEFAAQADDGGQGFLDLTNDRDVVLADVNLDGWLDVITAVTLSDGLPKTISHPRVYLNLGAAEGVWHGLCYEQARIPTFEAAPRFNAVAAGDVNGDGFPDLYLADSDPGPPAPTIDLDDRLLINDGSGFFSDGSTAMTAQMLSSVMATSAAIADINGDGHNDVVKSTSLGPPIHVAISSGGTEGFDVLDPVYTWAPYFFSLGELNNDGRLDIVVTDAGVDRYLLNQGNDEDGSAAFETKTFAFEATDQGFGGNSVVADLDQDGFADVLITDVDVDLPGCNRRTHIFRNLGDAPDVTLVEQGTGAIPESSLQGTHDAAVFDLDGDGMPDLVLGRCSGTGIWINRSARLTFSFPQGPAPATVPAGAATAIQVQITPIGAAVVDPGSPAVGVAIGGGPFVEIPMSAIGRDLYEGLLPAAECGESLSFFFTAQTLLGGVFNDPPAAPGASYTAIAAGDVRIVFEDDIEGDASGWTVDSDPALVAGEWEHADPVGTQPGGEPAAPDDDASQDGTLAFVTGNGAPGAPAGADDVDGGPTRLISPVVAVGGGDALVTYSRWFSSGGGANHVPDFLTLDLSNDGGLTWVPVPEQTTGSTGGAWETVSFLAGGYLEPGRSLRLRFSVSDVPNNSITEAGVDDVRIEAISCATCAGDVNGDGAVAVEDLVALILAWGSCPGGPCPADLTQDGLVDVQDLVALILAWGPC